MLNVFERIQEVFEQIIKAEITDETTFEFLCLDPLDRVQLICDIEEQFKIEIDDDVAEGFKTVGDIHRHVLSHANVETL